ncbi:coronin-1C isoform X2 [Mixophyes fleayi]|uniref:coronin-1C isoform X2 n=1 Tax=Mixophyes fleayi TaxID=3061075 RepID=UPI003F4DD67F
MNPVPPSSAEKRSEVSMQMREVDFRGIRDPRAREDVTEYQKLGDRALLAEHSDLEIKINSDEGHGELDELSSPNPLTSAHLEQTTRCAAGPEGKAGGGAGAVNVPGDSVPPVTEEMSSKECIQRRKCKVEERSVSWDVLDSEGFPGELVTKQESGMMDVRLANKVGKQNRNTNVLLYKMKEDESRVWSEGYDLPRCIQHKNTESNNHYESVEQDDTEDHRLKKVKLYRRAQSENLISYLQGSIRRLTRSASETSEGNRQVSRMLIQRDLEKSLSTDQLLKGGVHRQAMVCSSIQLRQADWHRQNDADKFIKKEPDLEIRAPPKRIYQLHKDSVRTICDSADGSALCRRKDDGPRGAGRESPLWDNVKPPQDTPPCHCAEGDKGVLSERPNPQAGYSSLENNGKPRQLDSEEDTFLSVADARRAFEIASSSRRKAAACPSKPDLQWGPRSKIGPE